jgi:hypothetical protein
MPASCNWPESKGGRLILTPRALKEPDILPDNKAATGIRINHKENKVINIGTMVSPAPRNTPLSDNMVLKIK